MAVKGLVSSIVEFLTNQLESGDISEDSRESLEVVIQCLETAYGVQASDAPPNFNLYEVYKNAIENAKPPPAPEATPEAKAEADRLRNEGNKLLKQEKYHDAIASYTKAIQLDGRNAVYYCNRAAAYSKIGNYRQVIKDSNAALAIDPNYSKAYSRLGLAYTSLNKHKEAKEHYQKALELDPGNESYKTNLQLAEEMLAQPNNVGGLGGRANMPGRDLIRSLLVDNPALMNMAQNMLSDPTLQNALHTIISGDAEEGRRIQVLLEAGQQLTEQMQRVNPDLIEALRQQIGGNANEPDPPQQN